jgi:hypothetical protein
MWRRLFLSLVLFLGCACGGGVSMPPDASPPAPDAAEIDSGGGADASPTAAREARELVSGGGRVTGGNMTMDVQFGHPVRQAPATGGSIQIEGGAAIKP